MRHPLLFVSLSILALAGCAKTPGQPAAPELSGATVQLPAVPGRPAVAYFTLTAPAKAALVGVQVAHFPRAEMHQSKMEGGTMTMDQVDRVPLTPGKPLAFAPGGYHVMLFDGDGTLKPGGTTELTLTLDSGDKISATAKVTATGADMAM
jgi:copper(I)-binding protein